MMSLSAPLQSSHAANPCDQRYSTALQTSTSAQELQGQNAESVVATHETIYHQQQQLHESVLTTTVRHASPQQQFACLYTKQKTQKRKTWLDGRLVVHGSKATLHAACPAPGSGDPVLDQVELQRSEVNAILNNYQQHMESEKYLINVDGPWTAASRTSTIAASTTGPLVSNAMRKVLTKKFQRPAAVAPPPPPPSSMTVLPEKRRRPLQPGELVRRYYPSATAPDNRIVHDENRQHYQGHEMVAAVTAPSPQTSMRTLEDSSFRMRPSATEKAPYAPPPHQTFTPYHHHHQTNGHAPEALPVASINPYQAAAPQRLPLPPQQQPPFATFRATRDDVENTPATFAPPHPPSQSQPRQLVRHHDSGMEQQQQQSVDHSRRWIGHEAAPEEGAAAVGARNASSKNAANNTFVAPNGFNASSFYGEDFDEDDEEESNVFATNMVAPQPDSFQVLPQVQPRPTTATNGNSAASGGQPPSRTPSRDSIVAAAAVDGNISNAAARSTAQLLALFDEDGDETSEIIDQPNKVSQPKEKDAGADEFVLPPADASSGDESD